MNQDNSEQKTHFGFQDVDVEEKQEKVADVFHSVAAKYDIMNDLMSMGVHRIWKKITIEMSAVRSGQRVLDIAGGTGDLTYAFSKKVGANGQVVLADINDSMLKVGRDKLADRAAVGNIDYVQANAQALPFPDDSFDVITIAFGLRNVTDKQQALESMYRVLKPGGRLLILEFSKIQQPQLAKLYDLYSFNILPKMGKLVSGDADSYQYLAESIRMHPDQQTLEQMMQQAGFERTSFKNMTAGVVAIHKGFKF
jgi:demethylmenaquinone methyltransferase / 2-methoxy-6-polyprenyl-1,4-benzoquinol methylase